MKRLLLTSLAATLIALPSVRLAAQPTTSVPATTPATSPTPAPPPALAASGDSLTGLEFYNRLSYGIGLNVGLLSGAGLSGRVMFPHGLGVQLAFFVMTWGTYTHFNIGAEAQYAFIKKRDWRLYGVFGMGFYSSTSSDSTLPGNRIVDPFHIGGGVGYEWFASDQFVIHVAGAITVFTNTGKVYPLPEAGFHFYFH